MTENEPMQVRMSGGFHGDAVYARMSPTALLAVRDANWWDDRRAAIVERERRERVAAFEEASRRRSVEMAAARGEHIDPRQAAEGVGRTHRDVLMEASARMDVEDRREAYRRSREGAHITEQDWSDMHSADTSAPDVISDEGRAEAARLASQIERGRAIREDKRRAGRVAKALIHGREQGWW